MSISSFAHWFSAKPQHSYTVELERESDGRWLADVPTLRGVMAYGATPQEAISKAQALALRVIADRLEHDEFVSPKLTLAILAPRECVASH